MNASTKTAWGRLASVPLTAIVILAFSSQVFTGNADSNDASPAEVAAAVDATGLSEADATAYLGHLRTAQAAEEWAIAHHGATYGGLSFAWEAGGAPIYAFTEEADAALAQLVDAFPNLSGVATATQVDDTLAALRAAQDRLSATYLGVARDGSTVVGVAVDRWNNAVLVTVNGSVRPWGDLPQDPLSGVDVLVVQHGDH